MPRQRRFTPAPRQLISHAGMKVSKTKEKSSPRQVVYASSERASARQKSVRLGISPAQLTADKANTAQARAAWPDSLLYARTNITA